MRRRSLILMAMLAGVSSLVGASSITPRPCLIWNVSKSVPIGFYAVLPVNQWYVNELVAVLPQGALSAFLASGGYLPPGVPMLKRILALPGQTVCRRGVTISVDKVEFGVARLRDGKGRALPDWQGCVIVGDGEIFLMNWQSGSSLDGRYFGLTAVSDVVGLAIPVWIREP